MLKAEKITILVNSCDKYSDVWDLFFVSLNQNWPSLKTKIVLNCESLTYRFGGLDINTFSLFCENSDSSWGLRLKKTIGMIETEYLFFLMDDYILEDLVNEEMISTCLQWLENDESIAAIYFLNIEGPNVNDGKYPGFELLPQRKDYKLNTAPGIWRVKSLEKYIGEKDSPWGWEFFGSSRAYNTEDKFYCLMDNAEMPYIYSYHLGGAIHRGKWVESVVVPLAKKYNVNINFKDRGFELSSDLDKNSIYRVKRKCFFFVEGLKTVGMPAFIYLFRSLRKRMFNGR